MQYPYYALIMAGGTGSRLWPHSRTSLPKQFLALTGDNTLLQQALDRIQPLISPENSLIATNKQYVEIVAKQLPEIPAANVLGEPAARGTAAAIGLAAVHIHKRNPEAVMAVLPSDHMIKKVEEFRRVLEAGRYIAAEGWLVTLGIPPSYPETGYGYIERGDALGRVGEVEGFRVRRFVEKPDRQQAARYLEQGNYDWNSGMFVWRVDRILEEMKTLMPGLYSGMKEIEGAIGSPDLDEVVEQVFDDLKPETIDYGIMEKSEKVAVLPVDLGWNDVGSWSAVYDVLPKDVEDNVVVGQHVSRDTKKSLIYSPTRLVATIGLEDVVIVDTEDVILICDLKRAQEVRKVVDLLKTNGDSKYLHGITTAQALAGDHIQALFAGASQQEQLALTLILHAGLWPSVIVGLRSEDIDLIRGWVNTPQGKRPLPDLSREIIFGWMQAQNQMTFDLSEFWPGSEAIKTAIVQLGEKIQAPVSVDNLYETLARALFNASEEGQAIRSVIGEEANLVRAPLHALFPFSLEDFSGNEANSLGERAQRVLNRACQQLSPAQLL